VKPQNRSPRLAQMIESSADGGSTIEFLPYAEELCLSELLDMAVSARRRYSLQVPVRGTVAIELRPNPASIAAFLGALLGGYQVVSLPSQPRGSGSIGFAEFRLKMLSASAPSLVVSESDEAFWHDWAVAPVMTPDSLPSEMGDDRFVEGSELVQFTSGSLGEPAGVVITTDALAHNIDQTIRRLEYPENGRTVSWLPLSHDMGLVGMLLTSIASGAAQYAGCYHTTLCSTEWFTSRPQRWLELCSEREAWLTAVPPSILSLVGRLGSRHDGSINLRRLVHLVLGSEVVDYETVLSFENIFRSAGLLDTALNPAYGMAELGLTISIGGPGERWCAEDDGAVHGQTSEFRVGRKRTMLGRPLCGYAVLGTGETGSPGRLRVSGPSMFRSYMGSDRTGPDGEGWFTTSDIGCVHEEQVIVFGRSDEVVAVGGRKVFLSDVDMALVRAGLVRSNSVQAVRTSERDYHVVVEGVGTDALVRSIRQLCNIEFGRGPESVEFVRKGSLHRTPSGKPRRSVTAQAVLGQDPSA
jgi:fatty-acyl-CoA synthase